ncbi:MAG: hypothetical protein RLN60_04360 [Phycisphaerales bacterium]
MMLLKNLTTAVSGTVSITNTQPRYIRPQAPPKAMPARLGLMVFMSVPFVVGISVFVPVHHHEEMAPKHEHDEDEQDNPAVNPEERKQEDDQQRYRATKYMPFHVTHWGLLVAAAFGSAE